jgi:N-acetylglucosamine-6-sulfatase
MLTKFCKGKVCIKPWPMIHPNGDVQPLKQALNPEFDHLYALQPKIKFDYCALGYFPNLESSQDMLPYIDGGHSYMQGSHWSSWT